MAAAALTPAELQALILQLQSQVATLTSGATSAGPAPAVVLFADTPQFLYADDLIDYSTKQGSRIYEQGCKTLDDLLACVAGPPLLDTGQFNVIMYLFIFILPIINISLMHSFFPKNPKSLRFLKTTILRGTPWAFRGHRGPIWRRRCKVKTKVKNRNPETTATTRHWLRAHLFALTMASLKGYSMSGQVHFDSDSFPIRIDIHTSTHTPIFYMAFSSSTYRSFAATFEAIEAPFLRRETTLQLPGPWFPREYVIPEEFVAEEDLHQGEKKSVDVANEDDDTVRTSTRIHQRPRRRTPPFPPLTTCPSLVE